MLLDTLHWAMSYNPTAVTWRFPYSMPSEPIASSARREPTEKVRA